MKTYVLIDFANLMFRCKYVGNGDIYQKAGMALHLCFNSLRMIWRKFNADHAVVCLEGGSWRKKYYSSYKADRRIKEAAKSKKDIEDDKFYFKTMDTFTDYLKNKTNVTVLQTDDAEADDFIARWIQVHPDDKHIIFSGDSDFYQLLSDKVKIYDGVKGWTISTDAVLDENDKPATKTKTITTKVGNKTKKTTTNELILPPNPEYELFKKILRGDSSDNIMGSIKPGTRENGTIKNPGILEAFNDRHIKGWNWNTIMLNEWEKPVGENEDGSLIINKVKVIDEFKINQMLIDLSKQPEEIKNLLDKKIMEEIQKPKKTQIGIGLLKFTKDMELNKIGENPNEYAKILASSYS